jgi:nicotinamide-nucleotide amidase
MLTAPRIELICIGTELLSGRVNTHTAFIGKNLASVGLEISLEHAVGDNVKLMEEVFSGAWKRSDVVIAAGGLGPTFDDLTRDTWARVLRRPLEHKIELVRHIEKKFASRGISMPPENIRQGYLVKGAQAIPNHFGTATGQFFKAGKKILFLLPGPTNELKPMLENFVLPKLKAAFPNLFSVEKSFHLLGTPESKINHQIEPLVSRLTDLSGCRITHGILASQSIITVKFRVDGKNHKAVRHAAKVVAAQYKKLLGDIFFGEDDDTLPHIIGQLLSAKKKSLAVAESCTGGLLSKMITDVPGASKYFLQGLVTYSNLSKIKNLKVKGASLKKWGAVSAEVARAMAAGLKQASGTDYALSITGVAGPDGGTKDKPVGLVFVGLSSPKRTYVHRFLFKGDRHFIRIRAALTALEILRTEISGDKK